MRSRGSRGCPEAFARHGIDPSIVEVATMYGKNPNLIGPKGQPWELISELDSNGEIMRFERHPSEHFFSDKNEFELPHYHGPNGEHLTYRSPYRGYEMKDASSYWSPLCHLVLQLRCWVRIAWKDGASRQTGHWGQLLTIPVDGYLEGPGGPIPFLDIEWVEVSTNRIKGGIAGQPRQMIVVKDELLGGLRGAQLDWELRESTWSVAGVFEEEEAVQVVRVVNPFGPTIKS